jgi:hypothetical protein
MTAQPHNTIRKASKPSWEIMAHEPEAPTTTTLREQAARRSFAAAAAAAAAAEEASVRVMRGQGEGRAFEV